VYGGRVELGFEHIPTIALIMVLGALLQGAVGFGMALFALPVMVWVGVELPVAIAVVQVTAITQMAWGCWAYREHIDWRPAVGVNACRLVTLPLGVLTLVYLVAQGTGPVKVVVGAALLLAVVVRVAVRVQPREKVRWWWAALAGLVSGYTGGLVAMSGPAIVLWVTAHRWSTNKSRVMMWISMLPLIPVTLSLLTYQYGMPIVHGVLLGLAMVPVTLLGAMSGTNLGARMAPERLRGAALVVLTIIAVVTIVEPWVGSY
jgi:uncharacterized protein